MRETFTPRLPLVATALAGTAVALIIVEIALRLIGFEFALYPTEVQFGWPEPLTLKRLYQIDKQLLWVPKDYLSKVAAWKGKRPSVVLMGDSCTEFGKYGQFLASIIAERHPHCKFTFVNVGVGGWSSYQGLQQLKRDILPMQPRVVTIYYGWNDHWSSFGIEDKDIGRFNLDHSDLLLILFKSRAVQLVHQSIFPLLHPAAERNQRRPERVSLPDFTSNLLQMVHIARDHGITPLLLTAPSSHKRGEEPTFLARRWLNDLRDLVPLHQNYVQAVRDIAAREQVPLVDLYAEFNQPSDGKMDPGRFFLDGIHLTEQGNRIVAQLMYEYMARTNLLDDCLKSD